MRIRCHQCGRYVTPELAEFEFRAVVMCLGCAEENDRRFQEGEEGILATEPKPLPYVADIMGESKVRVRQDEINDLREHVESVLGKYADEFLAALPTLRDAFQAMNAEQRTKFAGLLSTVIRAEDVTHDVRNPFAAFAVEFKLNVLEPTESDSPYAGHYAGRGWQGINCWLELLEDAVGAWSNGSEFNPTRDECIQSWKESPSDDQLE